MHVRRVHETELAAAGELVVAAYRALPGGHLSDDYAAELSDTERRAREAEVLVAVAPELAAVPHVVTGPGSETGSAAGLVGCVTFVPDDASPWAELLETGEAGIRMLAVLPGAQGRGVGRALVEACVTRARELSRRALLLHTTPWMSAAQRLYESAGFERFPERDWTPVPDVPLVAYRLELS